MNICAISDLHGILPDLPPSDLLLIAGDICPVRDHSSKRQRLWLQNEFSDWLRDAPTEKIIGVAGNHDFIAQADPRLMSRLPWTYLQDESVMHYYLLIHGSPWTPTFGPWAFMKDDRDLSHLWELIPQDVDILITHGPAAGYGGETARGVDAGSVSLRARIDELANLKLHVFGHIHEAYGDFPGAGVAIHANVSYVDLTYRPRPTKLREFIL